MNTSEKKDGKTNITVSDSVISKYLKLPHPRTFEPGTLFIIILTSMLGAIIGMELVVRLGITANTSIIGALIAVLIGFIPMKIFEGFKNIHRQNLIESAISAATFGAGNVLLLAMGVIWLLGGEKHIVISMFIGAAIGMIVDATMIYWLFDTPVFAANEAWPPGVATSETILAVASGGKRALILIATGIVGAIGQSLKIPMDVFGIAWIGNKWALLMFALGLLIRGYSPVLFGVDINDLYIPHGIMIGAGIVALIQITLIIRGKHKTKQETQKKQNTYKPTRSSEYMKNAIKKGFIIYIIGAILIAMLSGIYAELSTLKLILWIVFAAVAALVSEFMVGIAAMHAGWFPGFATTLIFLVLGMLMKFPTIPLGLLVGYTACTGPAFADKGYDLKTGWLLRGRAKDPEYELFGRKQQHIAGLIGSAMAILLVAISYKRYFSMDLIPPVGRVFATTIQIGAQPQIVKYLLIWSVVGAIIQFIGGSDKQLGILFSTGLLILNPNAGFAVIISLLVRIFLERKYGKKAETPMYIAAAGFIAGSTLYGFVTNTMGLVKKK